MGPVINLRNVAGETWTNGNIARLASKARHKRRILVVRFDLEENVSPRNSNSRNLKTLPSEFFVATLNDQQKQVPTFPLTPIVTVYCNDTTTINSIANLPQEILKIKSLSNVQKQHRVSILIITITCLKTSK